LALNHPASLSVEDLLKNCQAVRTKRSGPGGQRRNKVETAVVIEHLPSGVRAEASERRSQQANREQSIKQKQYDNLKLFLNQLIF
jgi:protein subunit release factor B